MKLYQLTWTHCDVGNQIEWHTSKRAAEKSMRDLVRANKDPVEGILDGTPEIRVRAIPTTRTALCRWLNVNLNSDNG